MPDKNKQFKDANSKKDFDKMLKSVKVLHDLEKLCSKNPLKCEDLDKKILCDSTLILLGYPSVLYTNQNCSFIVVFRKPTK